jgi:hypothetical protein
MRLRSGSNSLFLNILPVSLVNGIFCRDLIAKILKTKISDPGGGVPLALISAIPVGEPAEEFTADLCGFW